MSMTAASRKKKGSSPSSLAAAAVAAPAHSLGRSGCMAAMALSLSRGSGSLPALHPPWMGFHFPRLHLQLGGMQLPVIPCILDLGIQQLGMHTVGPIPNLVVSAANVLEVYAVRTDAATGAEDVGNSSSTGTILDGISGARLELVCHYRLHESTVTLNPWLCCRMARRIGGTPLRSRLKMQK